jgi:predicted metal-dependent phosphotriesterase family hydrolase
VGDDAPQGWDSDQALSVPDTLTRREWLTSTAALIAAGCGPRRQEGATARPPSGEGTIETVTGPVRADRLGLTLMHEHVLVDFIGAAQVSPARYDRDIVFKTVLPHLQRARQLGCETLVECTPAYLGRDPRLLKRLSDASGVLILSNTGYYGAAKDKHVPRFAFTETAEQLAARWIREARRGIDDTDIKPAFMKIGVDDAPLSALDAKLVRAASLTHRETGLPIASHTGTGAAAMEELDLLEAAAVPASAFIWVHAQSERDPGFHARAAKRGAWVELDGLSPASLERHLDLVQRMKTEGLLDRVLLSHDAGWYHVGEPGGGTFRSYETLFTDFIPRLKSAGFADADLRRLLVDNPRRALVRPGNRQSAIVKL